MAEVAFVDGIAYREAGPPEGPVAVLVHGFPESSVMWGALQEALAAAGIRSIAPDLIGLGDSAADRPGTWHNQIEMIARLHAGLGLDRVALVVHDWGGLIALRWACDHPEHVSALVISDTGFFADGKWNAVAQAARTPGTGEELAANMSRELLGQMLTGVCPPMPEEHIDAYWAAFERGDGRRTMLDFYRTCEFPELEPYEPKLAALHVPTLLAWGAKDEFAPIGGAYRFAKQIPHAEMAIFDDLGHFLFDEDPGPVAERVAGFLADHL